MFLDLTREERRHAMGRPMPDDVPITAAFRAAFLILRRVMLQRFHWQAVGQYICGQAGTLVVIFLYLNELRLWHIGASQHFRFVETGKSITSSRCGTSRGLTSQCKRPKHLQLAKSDNKADFRRREREIRDAVYTAPWTSPTSRQERAMNTPALFVTSFQGLFYQNIQRPG